MDDTRRSLVNKLLPVPMVSRACVHSSRRRMMAHKRRTGSTYEWLREKEQITRANPHRLIKRIAGSELIIRASLQGIVLAAPLGVPVRVMRPKVEPTFSYDDYFLGTGREDYPMQDSVADVLKGMESEKPVCDADGFSV